MASPGQWLLAGKIASLRAVDPQILEVRLTAPEPQFFHAMAMPFLFIVPRECVEHYGADFAWHPVGTGPFRLKSHSPKHFEWERNPLYREVTSEGEKLPFLDEIIDDVIEEDQTVWLAFLNGEHDVLGRVSPERVASGEVQGLEGKGLHFLRESAADFTYFAFNMDDPVVGGYSPSAKNLRKALSLAFEAAPVIDKFYAGMAKPAQFLVPPGFAEYDPTYKNPWGVYNLAKAREYLAKAGYPRADGLPELVLDAPSDTNSRLHAEYFARCMERIGIRVRMNLSSWPDMLARVRRRQGQIYAVSWLYDYPDVESGLAILVAANASPGPNKSNYKSAQWDRLYEQVRNMQRGPKRTALVKQMRSVFEEDVPWIFGVHRTETRLLHPWVKNYKIHLFDFGIEKYIRMGPHGTHSEHTTGD